MEWDWVGSSKYYSLAYSETINNNVSLVEIEYPQDKECVLENGILWLVKKSYIKGCNIKAKNFNIKYNDKYVLDLK